LGRDVEPAFVLATSRKGQPGRVAAEGFEDYLARATEAVEDACLCECPPFKGDDTGAQTGARSG
jgi:hypothetical protein